MKKSMTSKERVLTAFNHCKPDRVPIDIVAVNADIGHRLMNHFGLEQNDHDGLRKALHVDFRVIEAPYIGPRIHAEIPNRRIDPIWGTRCQWIENEYGGYWDYCDFPLKSATLEEVESWPMPSPDDFDYAAIRQLSEKYSNYCVVYGNPGLGDIMNSTGMIRTMEQVYMDIAVEDPAWLKLVDRRINLQLEIMARALDAANGRIDLIWTGEDLGSQNAPLMSLEMFRKILRPRHQRIIDLAKAYDLPIMTHSCGSSSWVFDDFIEMGINVVDTLQPEAKDMSPAYIKKTFGSKLAFHGCISTAGPLAYGTVEEAIKDVRETLEIMMSSGGYAFAPTHSIQDNSPIENVVAAFETAYKFGNY